MEDIKNMIIDWAGSGCSIIDFDTPAEGLVAGQEEIVSTIKTLTEEEISTLSSLLEEEIYVENAWNQADITLLNSYGLKLDKVLDEEQYYEYNGEDY